MPLLVVNAAVAPYAFYLLLSLWVVRAALDAWTLWQEAGDATALPSEDDEPSEEDEVPLPFPCWVVEPNNAAQCTQCVGFLVLVPLALLFSLNARWVNWQLTAVTGASSGSTTLDDATVAYSAAGYFGNSGAGVSPWMPTWSRTLLEYTNYGAPTCVGDSSVVRWGDDNGLDVVSYPPDPANPGYPDLSEPACVPSTKPGCLVTLRPSDYPNPAKCVAGGMFYGLNRTTGSAQEWCPGTQLSPDGKYVGRAACPYCLAYAHKHQGFRDANTAYCPVTAYTAGAEDNTLLCSWSCPLPQVRATPTNTRAVVAAFDYTALWFASTYLASLADATRAHAP